MVIEENKDESHNNDIYPDFTEIEKDEEYRKELEEFLGKKVYLELYCKTIKKWREKDKYIKDLGAIKLILYYYMRSKSKESDLQYLNLISDIKKQLHQIENKSGFIQELAKNRNKNKRNSDKE